MKHRKILYGVCGIGMGHAHRQLPIIEYFAKSNKMVIFAYGESYDFYSGRFKGSKNVTVVMVAVPFYVGNKKGIDFEATRKLPANRGKNIARINNLAFKKAGRIIGRPDLVISDYEPISAGYAYAHGAPLVTIDQQSKYLAGNFPLTLRGFSYKDEVARLRLFFPRANARVACSFFRVETKNKEIQILPPILEDEIINLKLNLSKNSQSILIYISSQQEFVQNLEEVARICALEKYIHFHIFAPKSIKRFPKATPNVSFYKKSDEHFLNVLKSCAGIISTAGHNLLSEAMFLGIPVYAIPLPIYEQNMNAYIIDKYKFGLLRPKLERRGLKLFIKNLYFYAQSIKKDKKILLRRPGQQQIIKYLEKHF